MARPPANARRPPAVSALRSLPKPRGMTREQAAIYTRYGQLLVDAGTLAATDLPMVESAARVRAALDQLHGDPDASQATIAAFERLHKEQLVQLGLTPAARRAVQRLEDPLSAEAERARRLLE
jgi:hypothetical protein